MVIEWSDEDQVYAVSFPEFGDLAHTHGKTYEEATRMGEEALELLVETYLQEGQPLPQPRTFAAAAS